MGTFVISGSASGMGAATTSLLTAAGHRVVGIDVRDAEVVADLSTTDGRGRDPQLLVSLNYFGSVELFTALRPLLAGAAGGADAWLGRS